VPGAGATQAWRSVCRHTLADGGQAFAAAELKHPSMITNQQVVPAALLVGRLDRGYLPLEWAGGQQCQATQCACESLSAKKRARGRQEIVPPSSKEYCKGLGMQVMPDQQNALTAQGAGAQ